MKDIIILVDENDNQIGTEEKLIVHQKGLLHRAFSVFVFNEKSELLLQQRAASKYHSAGLWSNTCCSHFHPDETMEIFVKRRMVEEIGFSCSLKMIYKFIYKVRLENSLIEHELDYVFIGLSNESPILNPKEAQDYKWISLSDVYIAIQKNPDQYSHWFKIIINDSRFQKTIRETYPEKIHGKVPECCMCDR